jgi:hypothetical protein
LSPPAASPAAAPSRPFAPLWLHCPGPPPPEHSTARGEQLQSPSQLFKHERFLALVKSLGLASAQFSKNGNKNWTICLLEELKPKVNELRVGRLKWVLSTAMPLRSDFKVVFNGEPIVSSKETFKRIVQFQPQDLPKARIDGINKATGGDWKVANGMLSSSEFPSGVNGEIIVTDRSLVSGKSDDIDRSHGFFVRVRGRLVNESDPLFGLHPLSHQTFNAFRADLNIDDLNSIVTAPRDDVERGTLRDHVIRLLNELFNEARARFEQHQKDDADKEGRKKEGERRYVEPRLLEHPIANTIAAYGGEGAGGEPDKSWFYLDTAGIDTKAAVESLYQDRKEYKFTYSGLGRSERLVKFDPTTRVFKLNDDHDVVVAHGDDPRARTLLEDMSAAEVLLEVYLRDAGVPISLIGDVLERRDLLLRALSKEAVYSLEAIAKSLEDSGNNEYDLEIALVSAMRALGFNAEHISGAGEPDGLARFNDYTRPETLITLEAKSSAQIPSLGQLDFGGLDEHKKRYKAQYCLMVAPDYPGKTKEDNAAAARAKNSQISCWRITSLAQCVRAAKDKLITAQDIIDVITTAFAPNDVNIAVGKLLSRSSESRLLNAIFDVLQAFFSGTRGPDEPRTLGHISGRLSVTPGFEGTKDDDVRLAIRKIEAGSKGALQYHKGQILLLTGVEDLERRVASLLGRPAKPLRKGGLRTDDKG